MRLWCLLEDFSLLSELLSLRRSVFFCLTGLRLRLRLRLLSLLLPLLLLSLERLRLLPRLLRGGGERLRERLTLRL